MADEIETIWRLDQSGEPTALMAIRELVRIADLPARIQGLRLESIQPRRLQETITSRK